PCSSPAEPDRRPLRQLLKRDSATQRGAALRPSATRVILRTGASALSCSKSRPRLLQMTGPQEQQFYGWRPRGCGRWNYCAQPCSLTQRCGEDPMKKSIAFAFVVAGFFATAAAPPDSYSVLILGGTIYDGSGGAPYVGDIAIKGDKIVNVGPH